MTLYCLCSNAKTADQVAGRTNRLIVTDEGMPEGSAAMYVVLGKRMKTEFIGVEQRLPGGSRHYPNVDVRACENCGTVIVLEG